VSRASVLLLALASCATSAIAPPPQRERAAPVATAAPANTAAPVAPTADGGFSAESAFDHVRRLAGRIGPRPAGSAGYQRAVRYVEGAFVALGYETRRPGFPLPQGGRSWNVVARWPGSGPDQLLIGAHLDTVQGSPGGNDNASGVAVLVELARVLAEGDGPPPGLALVAFGAEESQPDDGHHIGSQAHVDRMDADQRDALELMVSADMIGKARPFIVGNLEGTPRSAARILVRTAREVGLRANLRTLGDISDHGPFALAGIPAAFLWTGDEPNHHQPTDVVRNVARRALARAGALLLALVEEGPAA